jgi:nucleotide-binding universal stress UspA family protein
MYRKILLAYDGSDFSDVALRQGADLASLCKAELHLLGIVETTGAMAISEAFGPSDALGIEQRDVQRIVQAAVEELGGQGLAAVSSVRIGDAADQIIAHAREIAADLVVLGHTNKGTLTRWLQGSVGPRLLNRLPCSLLVAARRG